MTMIESLDSVVPTSGQDMWAEICPCGPETELQNQTEEFSDSFMCPAPDGSNQGEIQNIDQSEVELNVLQKPWAPLQDSEVYLASLERRLQKIKGHSQEVTSKDMLRSLSQAKKECWDRFLQESFEHEAYVDGGDIDPSTLEQLKRWLQPEKVAVNAEEVQCLIPAEPVPEEADTVQSPGAAEQ
ncbi:coiled-coil domain-containing protein 32 isoform 1-T3 [Discoglossus pictus]